MIVFQRYFDRIASCFRERPELLANKLFAKGFIVRETLDKVHSSTEHSSFQKANILLMAVVKGNVADESDKWLKSLCKILSKYQSLKKVSAQIKKNLESAASTGIMDSSSSDSSISEDESYHGEASIVQKRRIPLASCAILTQTMKLSSKQVPKPRMDELMNQVGSVIPAKWKSFGRQLRIEEGQLEGIYADKLGNTQECFTAVFTTWRRHLSTPCTWEAVVRVLKSREVNESEVASSIVKWLEKQMASTIHDQPLEEHSENTTVSS